MLSTLIVTAILSLFTLGHDGLEPIHFMNNELVAIAKKATKQMSSKQR